MSTIGPLHDPVTWCKIVYTGEQVAQWDFQNKGRCIVLEVPLCNLLTSIYDFVPCDRVVQRAYWGKDSFVLSGPDQDCPKKCTVPLPKESFISLLHLKCCK